MPETQSKSRLFTETNSAAILTSTQLIDDTVYTDATGTPSKGIAVMGTDGTNPQIVLTDATGHLQVDVVGGSAAGKQYDDGDARGTATGTLAMVDDGANIQSMSGDNTGKLNVNVSNTPAVTVTGTVTANAGTNLNTSALALEAGNLATVAGDTTSIDGKITACNTGAVVLSSGTVTTVTNPVGVKNAASDTVTGISGTFDTIDVSLTNGTNRATVDASGYITANINGSVSSTNVGTAVIAGRKTVTAAGTAEVLKTDTTLTQGVIITALKDNTNNVFVGNSTVDKTTDKQCELEPGESTAVAVNNTNLIYVDVTTNGEGVQFIGS